MMGRTYAARAQNGLRGLLRNHGVESPYGPPSGRRRGRRVERELNRIGRQNAGVHLLRTEACGQAVRRLERIRAQFEPFQHGDPHRRKIALPATAHWLVRVMFTMLRSGEVWQTEQDQKSKDDRPRGRRQAKRSAA